MPDDKSPPPTSPPEPTDTPSTSAPEAQPAAVESAPMSAVPTRRGAQLAEEQAVITPRASQVQLDAVLATDATLQRSVAGQEEPAQWPAGESAPPASARPEQEASRLVHDAITTEVVAVGATEAAAVEAEHRVVEPEPAVVAAAAVAAPKQAWGEPIARFESGLTWLEERLLLAVLMTEMGALLVWVVLRGMALAEADSRGAIVRVVLALGAGLGVGALATRKLAAESWARRLLPGALALGFGAGAWLSRGVGVDYCQNLLNWLQNGSTLLLVGGLRGLVTRLTLWLALLGASLATSKGKHINIDVIMRFAPVRARLPLALLGWLAAAVMCVTAAWGFFDQLALGEFRVERTEDCAPPQGEAPAEQCEVGPGKKLAGVGHEIRRDLFLLGRQISLDLRSMPRVLTGTVYNGWLTPKEWNEWLRNGAWDEHYAAEDVEAQILSDEVEDPRVPAITIPGGEENPSGILIRDMNLVIPFGLLIIALRFVMRSLLAVSGHVVVDPNAAHAEDDDDQAPPSQAAASEVM